MITARQALEHGNVAIPRRVPIRIAEIRNIVGRCKESLEVLGIKTYHWGNIELFIAADFGIRKK